MRLSSLTWLLVLCGAFLSARASANDTRILDGRWSISLPSAWQTRSSSHRAVVFAPEFGPQWPLMTWEELPILGPIEDQAWIERWALDQCRGSVSVRRFDAEGEAPSWTVLCSSPDEREPRWHLLTEAADGLVLMGRGPLVPGSPLHEQALALAQSVRWRGGPNRLAGGWIDRGTYRIHLDGGWVFLEADSACPDNCAVAIERAHRLGERTDRMELRPSVGWRPLEQAVPWTVTIGTHTVSGVRYENRGRSVYETAIELTCEEDCHDSVSWVVVMKPAGTSITAMLGMLTNLRPSGACRDRCTIGWNESPRICDPDLAVVAAAAACTALVTLALFAARIVRCRTKS